MDLISAEPFPNVSTTCDDETSSISRAERTRLIDAYDREYLVLPADRIERRRAAHRLRYQVYCLENPFEDRSEHPDGLEEDEFDDHAVQSLLQRRADGTVIGTVRLILPDPGDVRGVLPFHRLCRPRVPLVDLLLPVGSMAEVSRFCISKELRRQRPGASASTLARYATLGLIRSLLENSIDNEISHWCMVVEPALLRFLSALGLQFYPLGPLVDHHGRRQPCHADLTILLNGVRERRREVWEVITDDGRLVPPPAVPSYRKGEGQRDELARAGSAGGPGSSRAGLALA